MSDDEPDLPEWLTAAILEVEPPTDAIDLVKKAFSWRTVEAELMELSYDSVLDEAGVRDASARRTMEFTAGDVSLIIEIDGLTIRGSVVGEIEDLLVRIGSHEPVSVPVATSQFSIDLLVGGSVALIARSASTASESPRFAVG